MRPHSRGSIRVERASWKGMHSGFPDHSVHVPSHRRVEACPATIEVAGRILKDSRQDEFWRGASGEVQIREGRALLPTRLSASVSCRSRSSSSRPCPCTKAITCRDASSMCCKRTRSSRCDILVLRLVDDALAGVAAWRAWRVEIDCPAEQSRKQTSRRTARIAGHTS